MNFFSGLNQRQKSRQGQNYMSQSKEDNLFTSDLKSALRQHYRKQYRGKPKSAFGRNPVKPTFLKSANSRYFDHKSSNKIISHTLKNSNFNFKNMNIGDIIRSENLMMQMIQPYKNSYRNRFGGTKPSENLLMVKQVPPAQAVNQNANVTIFSNFLNNDFEAHLIHIPSKKDSNTETGQLQPGQYESLQMQLAAINNERSSEILQE